ncbi:MAG: tetratricopeptide repeat protein [Elusimicrobiales bacterium]|nr:tetratricopeptide repeat protein [Elusimicrobiales bacterium]
MLIEKIEKLLNNGEINRAKKIINKIKTDKMHYYYYAAEAERMRGMISKSISLFKKSLKFVDNDNFKFKILIKLISLSRTIGNIIDSKRYIEIAKKINSKSEEFLIEKAMYLRLIEKYKKSFEIFEKLKKNYFKNKDYQGISYIFWAEAGIHRTLGNIRKSINAYKSSMKYAVKSNDKTLYLYSKLGLSGTLRIAGKLKDSYKFYYSCIKLTPDDDMFAKGYSYCGTANALRQMGKFKQAIKYYKKALNFYKKVGDEPDIALVLWGMAECYKKYNIDRALKIILQAKKYIKNSQEIRGKVLIILTESYLRYTKGEIKKAKKLFNAAIKLSNKHSIYTYIETFG